GPRRRLLHAHDERPGARQRDLPPARRRLHRPARVPPRLAARGAGADPRVSRRERGDRQRDRHRRRRRQGDLLLRAGDDPLLPRRGAAAVECHDLPARGSRAARGGAGADRSTRVQADRRVGRQRGGDRAGRGRAPAGGPGRGGASRSRPLDRPGGSPPLDGADGGYRRHAGRPSRRPAPVRDRRRGDSHRAGWADPCRARARVADRQLLARRRLEGHLGARGRRRRRRRRAGADELRPTGAARSASAVMDRSGTAATTATGGTTLMLARIAHELYWLGRNVSRAEHIARMIDGVFQADLQGRQDGPIGVTLSWEGVLAIMGSTATTESGSRPSRADTVALLSTDPANANSVVASLDRAREGARTVRDVISAEMWEAINSVHLGLADAAVGITGYGGPYSFVSYVKDRSALFWGVASRTMLRDEAYAFLDAGGRFESADMVLRMLRVALPAPGERGGTPRDGQALALLGAVGGLQAFRPAGVAAPSAAAVASFLLDTRSYPDSVAASIDAVRSALSLADANPRASEPVLRLSRVLADLDFRGRVGRREGGELLEVCEIVGRELALADGDIADRYFGGVTMPIHVT